MIDQSQEILYVNVSGFDDVTAVSGVTVVFTVSDVIRMCILICDIGKTIDYFHCLKHQLSDY